VVEYLWEQRNLRGLICLMERWSAMGTPTPGSRIFHVQALLELRLMDRTWLPLKRLLEEEPDNLLVLKLAMEMFLARGWPSRARKMLEEALARNPRETELAHLLQQLKGPPRTPPRNARELEQTGSPAQLLDLAERFLATGSFLRARSILERLRLADPSDMRVKDLLWGLEGDFSVGDVPVVELAQQLAPSFQDHSEAMDLEPLGAEEVTATRLPLEDDDNQDVEFPALFRRLHAAPMPLMDDDSGEITQARLMATPEELLDPDTATAETPRAVGRHEDTEIMMVIPSGGVEAVESDAPVHQKRKGGYDLRSTLDLQEYRSRMGMARLSVSDLPAEPDTEEVGEAQSDFLEEEDADLVVVTRKETSSAPPKPQRKPAANSAPMRVIEKVPIPEEDLPPTTIPSAPRPTPPTPRPATPRARPARPPASLLLALPVLLIAGVLVIGLLLWKLPLTKGARASAKVAKAIQSDRYDTARRAASDLEAWLPTEGPADPTLLAALARLKLDTWAQHDSHAKLLEEGQALLQQAMQAQEPPPLAHLAAAELAATQFRLEDAWNELEAYGKDDSQAWMLRSALHQAADSPPEALAALQQAFERGDRSARAHRRKVELQINQQDYEAAREALEDARNIDATNPRLDVLNMLLLHHQDPASLIEAATLLSAQFEGRYAPSRVRAHVYEAAADLIPGPPTSATRADLLELAFKQDAEDPDLLLRSGLAQCGEQHLLNALWSLRKAARYRPGDMGVQGALVRVLLELDRVDEARQQLEAAASTRPDHARLAVLNSWLLLFGDEARPAAAVLEDVRQLLEPYLVKQPGDGEAQWLLGYALAMAGDTEAVKLLKSAKTDLYTSGDPAQHLLIPRTVAALVYAGAPNPRSLEQSLRSNAMHDPWAHLILAWWALDQNRRVSAASYLAHAAEAGPETARVHYARGRFYRETVRNPSLARQSWEHYLSLEPSGARAQAAKAGLAH